MSSFIRASSFVHHFKLTKNWSFSMWASSICPENNKNIHIKTEPGTAGADATVYVWLLYTCIFHRNRTYFSVAPPVTCSRYIVSGDSDNCWNLLKLWLLCCYREENDKLKAKLKTGDISEEVGIKEDKQIQLAMNYRWQISHSKGCRHFYLSFLLLPLGTSQWNCLELREI